MSPHDPAGPPTPGHPGDGGPPAEAPSSGPPFPVVGIGASAGGLESFTELLKHLPADPGLAILYVPHLEPHHKSHLPELLSHVTKMPVREVREGMAVEADHLYIIPPNTNMALTDGKLTLTPRSPFPGQHMPIDHLFRSLATIHKNRSIAVLLSGGGTDGTLGFEAIKAEGGSPLLRTIAPPPSPACRAVPSLRAMSITSCDQLRLPASSPPLPTIPTARAKPASSWPPPMPPPRSSPCCGRRPRWISRITRPALSAAAFCAGWPCESAATSTSTWPFCARTELSWASSTRTFSFA